MKTAEPNRSHWCQMVNDHRLWLNIKPFPWEKLQGAGASYRVCFPDLGVSPGFSCSLSGAQLGDLHRCLPTWVWRFCDTLTQKEVNFSWLVMPALPRAHPREHSWVLLRVGRVPLFWEVWVVPYVLAYAPFWFFNASLLSSISYRNCEISHNALKAPFRKRRWLFCFQEYFE